MFKVSVIIPVYNAEKYIKKAVKSAIHLPEVGEIILVEDNSPDNALVVCENLQREFKKVKLYRHPNGDNRGAGASRNLGMKKAEFDFISFLDADDWYLSNRFTMVKEIMKDETVDGVYEPIGTFFYDQESLMFGKRLSKEEGDQIITFLKEPVEPKNLFLKLVSQDMGNFHTNGITLRKSLVKKIGRFSTSLKLHQDTEYWIRCAFYGKLVAPKNPKIVAIRGVHGENRINRVNFYSKAKFYKSLFVKFKGEDLTWEEKYLLYKKYIFFNTQRKHPEGSSMKKYPELLKIAMKTIF